MQFGQGHMTGPFGGVMKGRFGPFSGSRLAGFPGHVGAVAGALWGCFALARGSLIGIYEPPNIQTQVEILGGELAGLDGETEPSRGRS